MIRRSVLLLLVLIVSATTSLRGQDVLTSTSVKTIDGATVDILDYTDDSDLTVLCFWATWCSPCKKELDAIAELYEEWQEAYDVTVLAISTDDARALPKVKPMVLEKDWPFTVLTDSNQALMRALQFQAVPQTYVVNAAGEILYEHSGYLPGDEDGLADELANLIN
ncbi:MAG: TlpA family protein disulfide reductase [Saprospiraceae bacterium]|nr:TlpA family protein disulfide reductase [Saprospiraceae bacterium]